jgi:mRNA interferase MazF
MKRGEVWWVEFAPSAGGEIRKKRPAIIVSNDASNRNLNRVQVVPVTSNVKKFFPSESPVTIAGKDAKAMADQLTTVSKARLVGLVGRLTPTELQQLERVVMMQLGLQETALSR